MQPDADGVTARRIQREDLKQAVAERPQEPHRRTRSARTFIVEL
jgi:hypothetical protein